MRRLSLLAISTLMSLPFVACTESKKDSQPSISSSDAVEGGMSSPTKSLALPGEQVSSPVEGIVVPEGLRIDERTQEGVQNYVRYRVGIVRQPRPWVDWFSSRYPPLQPYGDWTYCGGGDAEDGSGMSRSWSRGSMGLLLNVNFVPRENEMEVIIMSDEFNDCEHSN